MERIRIKTIRHGGKNNYKVSNIIFKLAVRYLYTVMVDPIFHAYYLLFICYHNLYKDKEQTFRYCLFSQFEQPREFETKYLVIIR